MASSTLKEHSGQGFFKEKRHQKGPNLVSLATEHLPTVPGFLEIFTFLTFFCPTVPCAEKEKYSVKVSAEKSISIVQLQMVTRM